MRTSWCTIVSIFLICALSTETCPLQSNEKSNIRNMSLMSKVVLCILCIHTGLHHRYAIICCYFLLIKCLCQYVLSMLGLLENCFGEKLFFCFAKCSRPIIIFHKRHMSVSDFNFWRNQWGDNNWMSYGI